MAATPDPAAILARYPAAVPRYTSYPTAPHFQAELGADLLPRMLASVSPGERVSLYLHIPFCDKLCWFCGCHTKHTLKYDPVAAYVGTLLEEIGRVAATIGFRAPVGHIHFGGGSPSMLSAADMTRLGDALRGAFTVDAQTEISVEIDPSDVTDETLRGLQALGLTRASIGVQDFDVEVQQAINRPQSFELTRDVAAALRGIGVRSLNIDALYGLPLQSEQRLAATIAKVIELRPDRVALFGYAHVPWLKKHQTMIRDADLPDGLARFHQAALASRMMREAGYEAIGIDHFARPGDALAIAAREGTLHRNFQGYTTDTCTTLIGLGASSIGSFADGYVQNIVPTAQYAEAIARGELAGSRGYELTEDDRVRGWMITRLMCDFAIDFNAMDARFGAAAAPYLREARMIAAGDSDRLCVIEGARFVVPPDMRAFTRIVAARFDAYLNASEARYSKAV